MLHETKKKRKRQADKHLQSGKEAGDGETMSLENLVKGRGYAMPQVKHFIFNESGAFGNGQGQYGFNQYEMGDPNNPCNCQGMSPMAMNNEVAFQNMQNHDGLGPGLIDGGRNYEDHQTSLGDFGFKPIEAPAFNPHPFQSYIDLPASGAQLHSHGIDADHISECHLIEYGRGSRSDSLNGYEYCRAEIHAKTLGLDVGFGPEIKPLKAAELIPFERIRTIDTSRFGL